MSERENSVERLYFLYKRYFPEGQDFDESDKYRTKIGSQAAYTFLKRKLGVKSKQTFASMGKNTLACMGLSGLTIFFGYLAGGGALVYVKAKEEKTKYYFWQKTGPFKSKEYDFFESAEDASNTFTGVSLAASAVCLVGVGYFGVKAVCRLGSWIVINCDRWRLTWEKRYHTYAIDTL